MTTFGAGSESGNAISLDKREARQAVAGERCQWVTTMRRWMTRIDDSRTAEHARRLAAELEALAACKDVADRSPVWRRRAADGGW